MENLLLPVNRELNEREQMYREKFINYLEEINYQPLPNEQFAQCIDDFDNYRYYCDYYFASNYAYVDSVYGRQTIELKPGVKIGGKQRRNPTFDYYPEYLREILPNWEKQANKGRVPQYYFLRNSCPYTLGLQDKTKKYTIKLQDLMIVYFDKDNRDRLLEKGQVLHHIIAMDWSKTASENNNIWNLQLLTDKSSGIILENPDTRQHKYSHYIANKCNDSRYLGTKILVASDMTEPDPRYIDFENNYYYSSLADEKRVVQVITSRETGLVVGCKYLGDI